RRIGAQRQVEIDRGTGKGAGESRQPPAPAAPGLPAAARQQPGVTRRENEEREVIAEPEAEEQREGGDAPEIELIAPAQGEPEQCRDDERVQGIELRGNRRHPEVVAEG